MSDTLQAAREALAAYDQLLAERLSVFNLDTPAERESRIEAHEAHDPEYLRAALAQLDDVTAERDEARALLARVSEAWDRAYHDGGLAADREHDAAHEAIRAKLAEGGES